jgi:hypothetical protein
MSKVPGMQRHKKKRNITKTSKRPRRKSSTGRLQIKLSEFFRTSPLAEIDLSRDNSP